MFWLIKKCCSEQTKTPQQTKKSKKIVVNQPQQQSSMNHISSAGLNKRDSSSFGDLSRVIKKDRYQGQQLKGVPHGNGSMLYSNGDFYRGEWVNGKKEGRGLQIYQQLNIQYEGEWQNNEPYGTGKITEPNSSYYIGQFKKGIKCGRGQYYDFQKKKQFAQYYSNGILKQQKQIVIQKSKQEQFPTLVLDKERFNTEDLNIFAQKNPNIKQVDINFFLRYYGLCKLGNLEFIIKNLKQWTIKQVLIFLDTIQLQGYKQIFYQNKIKGKDIFTLTQKQLKQDLKMKIGDRKRFLNYRQYILSLDSDYNKDIKIKKKLSRSSYKLRSATSMKKVLRTVKNYAMYEESIQQQSSQSQKQSEKFHTNQGLKPQIISGSKERQYDSAAIQPRHSLMDSVKQSSLEKLIDPQSQRSSSHQSRQPQRQNLKGCEQINPSNHLILAPVKNGSINHKSEQDKRQKRSSDSKSSNDSSSQQITPDLKKKKTLDKSHQSTQIRELYQFLKQHRSLQFLIREKDIQKLELIGEGGFGKVYKGKYIGQLIAIKDYQKTGKHRHKQDFMKELEIISDLKHPNIVLYMGMCITANKYTLITQFLENGSLFDQLHKKKKKFSSLEQIEILFDIVKGMVYLHNMKKILHRDLKSSNVLIGQNWQVKLCDFGLSGQKKKRCKKNKNRLGTFQWMAPQVIRNEQKIDQFADVYSFGVIIWELLSQKIPYQGLSEQQIIGLVGYDNDHWLQMPKNGSGFMKQLMKKCLNKNANDRPTFIDIQNQFQSHSVQQRERLT